MLGALAVGEGGGGLELERLLSYLVGESARCIISSVRVRANEATRRAVTLKAGMSEDGAGLSDFSRNWTGC